MWASEFQFKLDLNDGYRSLPDSTSRPLYASWVPSIQRLKAKLLFIHFLQLLVIPNNVATNIPVHVPLWPACMFLWGHAIWGNSVLEDIVHLSISPSTPITLQNGCDWMTLPAKYEGSIFLHSHQYLVLSDSLSFSHRWVKSNISSMFERAGLDLRNVIRKHLPIFLSFTFQRQDKSAQFYVLLMWLLMFGLAVYSNCSLYFGFSLRDF